MIIWNPQKPLRRQGSRQKRHKCLQNVKCLLMRVQYLERTKWSLFYHSLSMFGCCCCCCSCSLVMDSSWASVLKASVRWWGARCWTISTTASSATSGHSYNAINRYQEGSSRILAYLITVCQQQCYISSNKQEHVDHKIGCWEVKFEETVITKQAKTCTDESLSSRAANWQLGKR
jgi:hypothetical protein